MVPFAQQQKVQKTIKQEVTESEEVVSFFTCSLPEAQAPQTKHHVTEEFNIITI